ncbi:MAG: DUF4147 domain-containing protein [Acidobacteriota bacterium]|nr:DUF4147 domain-containing protein [Acidobacteriota bacterium]
MPNPAAATPGQPASLAAAARHIFARTLARCTVAAAFAERLAVRDGWLLQDHQPVACLAAARRIRIVALGKAAAPMLQATLGLLTHPEAHTAACELRGVLVSPTPLPTLPAGFQYFPGGHPTPTQASLDSARATLQTIAEVRDDPAALVLFLISGGGSSMLELPLDPALSLDHCVALHQALVASGAGITQMNCIRKHFSAVKGGRLALAAGSTPCLSLLVSDVPEGHLDALASGPTLPDPTTVAECRSILAEYRLLERLPAPVAAWFRVASLPESPKPGQVAGRACVLLDSGNLARIAAQEASALGFHPHIDNRCDDWEYRRAADYLLSLVRQQRPHHPRLCLISTGELAVPLPTACSGQGGRNQQWALYAATCLQPGDSPLALLSAGSDGIDGNSPAAGAVLDTTTLANLPSQAQTALAALAAFDSYPLLDQLGATITTGPTGNNLRDLRLILTSD